MSSKINNPVKLISPLSKRRVLFRRIKIFGLMFISTLWATFKWSEYMPTDVSIGIKAALIILFALTFGWIALYFWSAIFGFWELVRHRKYEGIIQPPEKFMLSTKTAILIPTYNENPTEIYARILAMAKELALTGQQAAFDFFVLSDSTQPAVWMQEEMLWLQSHKHLPKGMNLFYRHRPKNTARKSGNIEDFCIRWGSGYDFMLVLDADSLITASTIVRMAQLMQFNPTTGIIQAPPMIVNSGSLFARMNQYAGRVYGQIVTAGLSYWQAWDSNYWGHNAIIRTQAFMDSCGLPVFKGKPPFGGHILSHDFVEAALIRRSGWLAWMLPELKGSYEECPPTMLDFATRDRRWCQGNLQHIRILLSQKLHPISRIHFTLGIMSYLSSPLWFLFLALGVGVAIWRYFYPPAYFTNAKELFPTWPVFNVWGTIALFTLSMLMLFFPKILGMIYVLVKEPKKFPHKLALISSFFIESLISALVAPIMMLFQTRFVAEILLGLDSGWKTQNRTDDTPWKLAIHRHGVQTLIGVLTLIAVYKYAHSLFYWMLPITIGLIVSIPLSVLTSRESTGKWLKKFHIFTTPEEQNPPALLIAAKKETAELKDFAHSVDIQELITNPSALAAHIYLLGINGPAPDFTSEQKQAVTLKVQAAINTGNLNLTPDETKYLLYQPELLNELALLLK